VTITDNLGGGTVFTVHLPNDPVGSA
jgi:hypothetical protein